MSNSAELCANATLSEFWIIQNQIRNNCIFYSLHKLIHFTFFFYCFTDVTGVGTGIREFNHRTFMRKGQIVSDEMDVIAHLMHC